MSWYADRVLPRVLDFAMRSAEFKPVRARVAADLDGEVLEIGFGSGLNLPHYPASVSQIAAVDPSIAGRKIAADRIAACTVPVEFAGLDAGSLPADDNSVDHVVSTWTMCSVPDPARVLAEISRVLRPGGSLHFAEHGLAPDAKVARLQHRLTPLQRAIFGGCHLDRPIDQLLGASDLTLANLTTYYLPGPRFVGYTFEGAATKP